MNYILSLTFRQTKKAASIFESAFAVPRAGIEPARVLPHRFLRPTRLPIPPPRHKFQRTVASHLRVQK